MGGAAKTVTQGIGRATAAVVTGGFSETKKGKKLGNVIGNVFTLGHGGGLDNTPGSDGAAPTLTGDSPAAILAQSGGAALLANIALGVDPDEALSGYLGQTKDNFDEYLDELPANERNAIMSVRTQLRTIKDNTALRNTAVDKIINDFPNIAQQSVQKARQLAQSDLSVFDDVSRQVLDKAANQLSAKFAATGGFSSGAFNEGLAKEATGLAVERAGMAYDRNASISDFEANIPVQQYQLRLAETNALREFQQNMLGQVQGQGFSAAQTSLQRNANINMTNNQNQIQAQAIDRQMKSQERNAMFGAIGSLGGSLLGSWALGNAMNGGGAKSPADPYDDYARLNSRGMASRPPAGSNYGPGY